MLTRSFPLRKRELQRGKGRLQGARGYASYFKNSSRRDLASLRYRTVVVSLQSVALRDILFPYPICEFNSIGTTFKSLTLFNCKSELFFEVKKLNILEVIELSQNAENY